MVLMQSIARCNASCIWLDQCRVFSKKRINRKTKELELKDYWNKPELFYFQKNGAYRNNLYLFPIVVDKAKKEIQTFPKSLDGYAVEVEKICPFMRSDPYGIYAIADGVVSFVHENGTSTTEETKKSSSYGNYVVIKHENGSQAMYAHLSNYTVKKGDKVNGGQQIGVMGGSGHRIKDGIYQSCKWPLHLHLSYFLADLSEQEMNPSWLDKGRFPDEENGMIKAKDPKDPIEKNHYPCNTKKTGSYHDEYPWKKDKNGKVTATYKHEGIDFSGRTANLIPNWEFGLYQQSL